MGARLALFCVLSWAGTQAAAQAQDEEDKRVTIGYQLVYNPWKAAIASGAFERATGYDIAWRKFASGGKVIAALASGSVQLAMAGSSPIAAGVSRGLNLELFWIVEDIASAEALVVRDGAGITAPQDLRGKRIGVPFASTTHFHTLFALEQFGIDAREVELRHLQPPEIVEAWDKGEIDAAFVWDPALGQIKRSGKVLITSGQLSNWGKATFDGLVVERSWAARNPDFMCAFVKTLAEADAAYRDNREAWTADSPEVQAIVGLIGGNPEDVPGVLELYNFPTLEEQASERWLGGGEAGGAAKALAFTSEFLKSQRKIPTVLEDYSRAVNPAWVEMVLTGGC
ncbi:MAG: taurine ABC transporter substrate-binding protein [Kiloniellales bacterium]|nr:taurine ABC transporter substrate-binding protein [Kiloniellales bacterium]